MATQADRRAATRAKLIKIARDHFARSGYDATHTNDILEDACLSRGALYHHFKSKQELFEAVFVALSDETIQFAMQQGVKNDSALEDLISASLAWLRAVRSPEIAAILLEQAPQVLGWEKARDLEAKTSLAIMKRSLERAVKSGEIKVVSLELSARLINALLAEAALSALHKTPATSIAKQELAVRQFILGLKQPL